jgi:hypothetical protein
MLRGNKMELLCSVILIFFLLLTFADSPLKVKNREYELILNENIVKVTEGPKKDDFLQAATVELLEDLPNLYVS